MRNPGKLLSLTESAELAGVATETLEQYRSFGLLEAVEQQGAFFFKESDIRTLFYTRSKDAAAADNGNEAPSFADDSLLNEAEEEEGPLKLDEILAEAKSEESKAEQTPSESVEGKAPAAEEVVSTEPLGNDGETEASATNKAATDHEGTSEAQSATEQADFHARVPAITDRELVEITKGLRQQVEMLREERDWLRERVEKLEARSEREQMMLLSESETLRSLIEPQIQRKRETFWRRTLLPLFGFEQNKR